MVVGTYDAGAQKAKAEGSGVHSEDSVSNNSNYVDDNW